MQTRHGPLAGSAVPQLRLMSSEKPPERVCAACVALPRGEPMAEVESAEALLVMAVQDLFDGENAMVERLEAVRGHAADQAMRELIAEDCGRSGRQRETLAGIAGDLDAEPGGATNIWLRAILDDADNDAKTIAHGRLRDIALAGALRKARQSQRVSYETAIALARRLKLAEAARALEDMATAAARSDAVLAAALARLAEAD
jgi:ferritin-like metal-binding protein YciE